MKCLASVLLAAAVCASEVEKREAEPSYGYRSRYTIPSYTAYNTHQIYKRSADPEADAEPSVAYSSASYTPTAPVYAPYSVHGYHKRSAEADASRGTFHGIYSHTPITYGGHSNHGLYKRSADPEAEASTRYYSAPSVYGPVVSYGHGIYKRSAEAEAQPSTPYAPVHYRPVSLYQP
ncbi:uncharacterized protein LOC125039227 [Penaeus chinensis]|uniref:uncharacterized protein LOC125039227 n=1 Tax=Penaeus chinensis TaxID=139456 RepID=UPI001FB682C9|nr:uncharacterized protein LOC125039227 [Penaeus chinensis]